MVGSASLSSGGEGCFKKLPSIVTDGESTSAPAAKNNPNRRVVIMDRRLMSGSINGSATTPLRNANGNRSTENFFSDARTPRHCNKTVGCIGGEKKAKPTSNISSGHTGGGIGATCEYGDRSGQQIKPRNLNTPTSPPRPPSNRLQRQRESPGAADGQYARHNFRESPYEYHAYPHYSHSPPTPYRRDAPPPPHHLHVVHPHAHSHPLDERAPPHMYRSKYSDCRYDSPGYPPPDSNYHRGHHYHHRDRELHYPGSERYHGPGPERHQHLKNTPKPHENESLRAVSSSFSDSKNSASHPKVQQQHSRHPSDDLPSDSSWRQLDQVASVDKEEMLQLHNSRANRKTRTGNEEHVAEDSPGGHLRTTSSLSDSPEDDCYQKGDAVKSKHAPNLPTPSKLKSLNSLSSLASIRKPLLTSLPQRQFEKEKDNSSPSESTISTKDDGRGRYFGVDRRQDFPTTTKIPERDSTRDSKVTNRSSEAPRQTKTPRDQCKNEDPNLEPTGKRRRLGLDIRQDRLQEEAPEERGLAYMPSWDTAGRGGSTSVCSGMTLESLPVGVGLSAFSFSSDNHIPVKRDSADNDVQNRLCSLNKRPVNYERSLPPSKFEEQPKENSKALRWNDPPPPRKSVPCVQFSHEPPYTEPPPHHKRAHSSMMHHRAPRPCHDYDYYDVPYGPYDYVRNSPGHSSRYTHRRDPYMLAHPEEEMRLPHYFDHPGMAPPPPHLSPYPHHRLRHPYPPCDPYGYPPKRHPMPPPPSHDYRFPVSRSRAHATIDSKYGGHGWSKDDDVALMEILKNFKNPKNWDPIANKHGRGKSARECQDRWTRFLKPGSRKGQWTDQEDVVVLETVTSSLEQPFTRWSDLAQRLPGRVGKQVRDRWVNHLNPNINHCPFSRDDDLLLWEGQKSLGKRWVEISTKSFKSTRSENHIKNRWYSASFRKVITNEFGADAYAECQGNETETLPCEGGKESECPC